MKRVFEVLFTAALILGVAYTIYGVDNHNKTCAFETNTIYTGVHKTMQRTTFKFNPSKMELLFNSFTYPIEEVRFKHNDHGKMTYNLLIKQNGRNINVFLNERLNQAYFIDGELITSYK